MAILRYALENANMLVTNIEADLPKITLKEIINAAYPNNITKILNSYLTARKVHYHNRNDIIGENEIFSEEGSDIFSLEEFV